MEFVVIFRITCSISNQTHLHGTIIYAIYKKSESPSQPIRVSSVISPHPIPQEWIQPDDPSMETFRKHHRQVRITIFLSMMQLFCGHPNVLNFAPQIFALFAFERCIFNWVCIVEMTFLTAHGGKSRRSFVLLGTILKGA